MSNMVDKDVLIGALERLGDEKIYIEAVINTVKAMETPKEKWLKGVTIRSNGYEYIGDMCSSCRQMVSWGLSDGYSYCPHCGKPMEVKGNEK